MFFQNEIRLFCLGMFLSLVNSEGPYPPALPYSQYGAPPIPSTESPPAPQPSTSPPSPPPVYGPPSTEPPSSPAPVYGVPSTEAPPTTPAPVYGVPSESTAPPPPPEEISYNFVIPPQPINPFPVLNPVLKEGPYPPPSEPATEAPPTSPAPVYGVPSTEAPPTTPAPVYGVPSTPSTPPPTPVETSYNYIIPPQPVKPLMEVLLPVFKEGPYPPPSEPSTEAPPTPAPVYGVPSTEAPITIPAPVYGVPSTEAPPTTPAPVYGVPSTPSTPPPAPIETSYSYIIPPQPVKPLMEVFMPVFKEGPYPPPSSEEPYPPPTTPAPVYGVPSTAAPLPPQPPVETSYEYAIPPQPVVMKLELPSGPYPPEETTPPPPAPTTPASVYGPPEVKIVSPLMAFLPAVVKSGPYPPEQPIYEVPSFK